MKPSDGLNQHGIALRAAILGVETNLGVNLVWDLDRAPAALSSRSACKHGCGIINRCGCGAGTGGGAAGETRGGILHWRTELAPSTCPRLRQCIVPPPLSHTCNMLTATHRDTAAATAALRSLAATAGAQECAHIGCQVPATVLNLNIK